MLLARSDPDQAVRSERQPTPAHRQRRLAPQHVLQLELGVSVPLGFEEGLASFYGDGALVELLAPLFDKVVAVDRSQEQLKAAEKRLSADSLNFAASSSGLKKGESLVDTALNLQAMSPDLIVIRRMGRGALCHLGRVADRTPKSRPA